MSWWVRDDNTVVVTDPDTGEEIPEEPPDVERTTL